MPSRSIGHDMGDEFLRWHPEFAIPFLGVLLMVDARFDYAVGCFRPLAVLRWFVGGVLLGMALFCWICGCWLFLGVLRYPVAVIACAAGMCALFRFRPRSHSGKCGDNGSAEPSR